MAEKRIANFFRSEKRQKHIVTVAAVLFFCTAVEILFSSITAVYEFGQVSFDFHLTATKLMCVLVYVSVAVLIALRVNYKYLLIPDFFLLCVKLWHVFTDINMLLNLQIVGGAASFTMWENLTESALFSVFLLTVFASKLLHIPHRLHARLPFFCLFALSLCFPFTLMFEIMKVVSDAALHALPPSVSFFNFAVGILTEAFFDLPYVLMIFIVFFVPQKRGKGAVKSSKE